MRRIAVIAAVTLAVLVIPERHPLKALPMNGITRYYYANACPDDYCLNNVGRPGAYLGERYDDCYTRYSDIHESDLVGQHNWKLEYVYDCQTGYYTTQWYAGGASGWALATPTDCVWYC